MLINENENSRYKKIMREHVAISWYRTAIKNKFNVCVQPLKRKIINKSHSPTLRGDIEKNQLEKLEAAKAA